MTAGRRILSAVAIVVAASPGAADAHPHMFVSARSLLVADADERLTGLRTALIIDPLTTQFVLDDHDIAPNATLTEKQRDAIAQGMIDGLRDYDFFTDLRVDDTRIALSKAAVTQVMLDGDLLAATLELTLDAPLDLRGRELALSLYDPTYFAAVTTLDAPVLPEAFAACTERLTRFEPRALDSSTLADLSQLSREEMPDDPRIGARFADRSTIACPE